MRYRPPRNKWGADFAEDYEKNLEDIERDITGVEEIVEGSKTNAEQALTFATEAKVQAESVQAQFNQVVIEGDSSVEAAQARVDAKNVAQPTLKARLDNDYNEVTAQLADKAKQYYIDVLNPPKGYLPLVTGWSDSTLNSIRLQAMLDNVATHKFTRFYFPRVDGQPYVFDNQIQIKDLGIEFFGDREDISSRNGTEIYYVGTTDFIVMGTEIPVSEYNDNNYGGLGKFSMKNLQLNSTGDVTLQCQGNEKINPVRCFIDNGGGSLRFENVKFNKWGVGVYLVQSDFNYFQEVTFTSCQKGAYLSPRSDQNIWIRPDFTMCEVGVHSEALNFTMYSPNFNRVGVGLPDYVRPQCIITNGSVTIISPWIENYDLRTGEDKITFCRVGVAGDLLAPSVVNTPSVKVTHPRVSAGVKYIYLVDAGNCSLDDLMDISTDILALCAKTGNSIGSFIANGYFAHKNKVAVYELGASNLNTGGQISYYVTPYTLTSTGRSGVINTKDLNEYYTQMTSEGLFTYLNGSMLNQQTRKRLEGGIPTSGFHKQGEFNWNIGASELGEAGSKYIIFGSLCVASGEPGTWVELKIPTGN
ncbi:hypothetical protein [Priestia flexa]|uniref:Uncharacterized protein n=1 Tax=Priestia flexa TaxID=86664 RepID=A0A8I1SNI4_9BACI|nr:hypothetical protein [Priestia flexa]MBN8253922.1 hypothetical protein [Priestia flexa]